MLLGEYQHNIDAKGRVIVPAKFREELGESFYVTKGLGGCLWAFPPNEWEAILQKFADMPIVDSRDIQRFFFSGATEAEPDGQGRILLPQSLRDFAKLQKDVTFLGVNRRVEIWNTQIWSKVNAEFDETAIAEKMALLGF